MEKHSELIAYLTDLGFSETDIQFLLERITIRDLKIVQQKVDFYSNLLKLSGTRIPKFFVGLPAALEYDTNSNEPTSVKSKIKFYQEFFKCSETEILCTISKFPFLLGLDITDSSPTSFTSKCNFYKNKLAIDNQALRNLIFKFPPLIGYDTTSTNPTSVITKIDFYKNTLDLHDTQISGIIVKFPRILSLDINSDSPTSVKNKLNFYKENLNLTNSQLGQMLCSYPCLLGLDTNSDKITSVKNKHAIFSEIMSKEEAKAEIVKHPNILSVPSLQFKIRYMLALNIDAANRFFRNSFMMNEKKVWARSQYLANLEVEVKNKNAAYKDEKAFQSQFHVSSDELIERYPLNRDAIAKIEETFNARTGKNILLSKAEKIAVLGE